MGLFSKKEIEVEIKGNTDSVSSLSNQLINQRQAINVNRFEHKKLDRQELKEIFKAGVARRIYQIKAGYALKCEMKFEGGSGDEKFYKNKLAPIIKEVAEFQLGFGRGIIVVGNKGDDLSLPLDDSFVPATAKLYHFSGDMVSVGEAGRALDGERYYKPISYLVRGHAMHWTRVIDFTYVNPAEDDKPFYQYGGMPEAELIYNQLIADGIIQRSNATIIEKASTIFYKLVGFKNNLRTNQSGAMVAYFATLERLRGIYGAGIMDAEDSVESVSQQINGLKEMDDVSLRRLAMVTGIPVPMLVGENVKGLNSTGDTERQIFNEMLDQYRSDYLIRKINSLMILLGRGEVSFKQNQGYTPNEKAAYDRQVLENALMLQNLGEDSEDYLVKNGIINPQDKMDIFKI